MTDPCPEFPTEEPEQLTRTSFQSRPIPDMWVIYEGAADVLHHRYCVRRWVNGQPDQELAFYGDSLTAARGVIPNDKVLLAPTAADDNCILEVWL